MEEDISEANKAFRLAWESYAKEKGDKLNPRADYKSACFTFFIEGYGKGAQAGIKKLGEAFNTINSS